MNKIDKFIELMEAHEKWQNENGNIPRGMAYRRLIWRLQDLEGIPRTKSPFPLDYREWNLFYKKYKKEK